MIIVVFVHDLLQLCAETVRLAVNFSYALFDIGKKHIVDVYVERSACADPCNTLADQSCAVSEPNAHRPYLDLFVLLPR